MNLRYFTQSEWAFIGVLCLAAAVYFVTRSTDYLTIIVLGGGLAIIGLQGASDKKTE